MSDTEYSEAPEPEEQSEDTGDNPRPPLEPPKLRPPASGRITIKEICRALMDEASRLNIAEAVAVDLGWRPVPDPKQKRREALFVAAADMLARLEPHQEAVRRLLAGGEGKKPKR